MPVTPRTLFYTGPAAVALLAARLWLRVAPGHAVRWASRSHGNTKRSPHASIAPAAWAIAAVGARHPFSSTCLEQGLALVMVLTALRIPSRLVIGVGRPDSVPRAHAWVEHDGRVVLGAAHALGLERLSSAASSPCRG
jgi:hypothetical protein